MARFTSELAGKQRQQKRRLGRKDSLSSVPVTGKTDDDDKAESGHVLNLLEKVDKAEHDESSQGYSFSVVFASEDQCNEFLRRSGWGKFCHDKLNAYLDGIALAGELGVTITPVSVRIPGQKVDRRLVDEVGTIE